MRPDDPFSSVADTAVTVVRAEGESTGGIAVLLGPGGVVLGTVTDSGVRPSVLVESDMTIDAFVRSRATTLLLLDMPYLVVLRDGAVFGVVAKTVVAEYLASGAHRPTGNPMGIGGGASDAVLPGPVRLPLAHVACKHPDCGHVNAIEYWHRDRPQQCANPDRAPHNLVLEV
ncbi:hypothetical protein JOD54_005792 [Actinokineospora baliensis]|uniref:hypothetical protein n=1 Tax=Actinokineospora baliensis TaxID=547056 RepID=UPI00195AE6AE|nr:hypothetical protein [Actinokineospora baliensis]MBM7775588.1 hypothetical protein [Actinokineospora baliensis]